MVFVNSDAVAPEVVRPPAQQAAALDADRDLELVLNFLNTCDVEAGTDVLDDPELWRRWCAERGLGAAPEPAAVREIRDSMRAAISCAAPAALVAPAWQVQVELRAGIPVLAGADALGDVLVAATHLVHTGYWDRIKICPAENCLWAFYDRSRNRSRTWCSMRVCGNREKARSWRERHSG
ncbi:CGNR zinc finger domain-containing protein [Saccharopolyspora erythraea]|uniref:CGNR zinc finger domain-containing protein n=1 Tax=Saccharopolyspora erythraea TaxID=1836 RepID=UPI001BA84EC1|nr:CGNR zinc finger domain-containing protein [Saccharopolyspora erythraea]QUH05333.1 CGNR zinc finger domain-containing protein [Saccharopolyspora erythraea]